MGPRRRRHLQRQRREPTLARNLGEGLALVKARTKKPVVVLTNAPLLEDPEVRRELALADVVSCKLDATNDRVLERMNRPVEGITQASIVRGIELLRAEHPGRVILQCMFMRQPHPDAGRISETNPVAMAHLSPHAQAAEHLGA